MTFWPPSCNKERKYQLIESPWQSEYSFSYKSFYRSISEYWNGNTHNRHLILYFWASYGSPYVPYMMCTPRVGTDFEVGRSYNPNLVVYHTVVGGVVWVPFHGYYITNSLNVTIRIIPNIRLCYKLYFISNIWLKHYAE